MQLELHYQNWWWRQQRFDAANGGCFTLNLRALAHILTREVCDICVVYNAVYGREADIMLMNAMQMSKNWLYIWYIYEHINIDIYIFCDICIYICNMSIISVVMQQLLLHSIYFHLRNCCWIRYSEDVWILMEYTIPSLFRRVVDHLKYANYKFVVSYFIRTLAVIYSLYGII